MAVEITALVNGVIGKSDGSTLRMDAEDAGTATVLPVLKLRRTSSGTPANGIGSGLSFEVETTAGAPGTLKTIATIEAVATDVTAGSEDGDIVFKTMAAGAAATEKFRLTSDGTITSVVKIAPTIFVAADASPFQLVYGSGGVGYRIAAGNVGSSTGLIAYSAATPAAMMDYLGFTLEASKQLTWTTSIGSPTDTGLARSAAGVIKVTDSSSGVGWIQNSAGNKRVATNVTNATVTMANVADLTVTLIAGRKYAFRAVLYVADSVAAEGIRVDFDGGTATMTSFRAHSTIFDTALLNSAQVTAIATDLVANTVTGDGMVEVQGGFVCNAAGTFIPRFAQSTHTTGTATLYANSHILIQDVE